MAKAVRHRDRALPHFITDTYLGINGSMGSAYLNGIARAQAAKGSVLFTHIQGISDPLAPPEYREIGEPAILYMWGAQGDQLQAVARFGLQFLEDFFAALNKTNLGKLGREAVDLSVLMLEASLED